METFAGNYFSQLVTDLIAQRGGKAACTPAELQLIYSAAVIGVESQFLTADYIKNQGKRRLDWQAYPILAKVQRALLSEIGLKFRKRKIDPKLIEGQFDAAAD